MTPVLVLAAATAAAAAVLAALDRPARPRVGTARPARPARALRGRSRRQAAVPVPLVLDLVAAVLASGAPVPVALRTVASALPADDNLGPAMVALASAYESGSRDAAPTIAPEDASPAVRELADVVLLCARTGIAPGDLVRATADDRRRRRREHQAAAAQRLAVFVVLPTGLCLLPAFVLLTVAPLVLSLLA